ncbi:hypothetical protein SAY86_031090 [Trapa natans]|uniref:Uncharacterized protein n=1 Tax=Trapa natans TaxID=22666 RepID=A0AAN7M676_TRANT|nr:hypothetical protein SAY86_031090 [Trapa natans]
MAKGECDVEYRSSLWGYGNLMSVHLALRVAIESNILNTIDSARPSMQLSTLEIASRLPIKDPRSIAILDQLLLFLGVKFLLKSSLRPVGPTPT